MRYMFQTKGQYKTPETDFSEMEISDLPDKDVKIMAVKMFNKEIKYTRTYQTNQS